MTGPRPRQRDDEDRPGLLILFRDERRDTHPSGDDERSSGTGGVAPDHESEREAAEQT